MTPTNAGLVEASRGSELEWRLLDPDRAQVELEAGDAALGRIDVRPGLDGVEDGLWALGALAARGVHVLNPPGALLAMHDKLLTARVLRRAGLPHPETTLLTDVNARLPRVGRGVVVKPRFGSWGGGVTRCTDDRGLAATIEQAAGDAWFREHGALVQELVPPCGHDLRVVVAGGRCVGAVSRVAAPGEWRTNVALGARRVPAAAPLAARELAIAASAAVGADVAGVDLLPAGRGWIVLELNGAVEFSPEYSRGQDVFRATVGELLRVARDRGVRPILSLVNGEGAELV